MHKRLCDKLTAMLACLLILAGVPLRSSAVSAGIATNFEAINYAGMLESTGNLASVMQRLGMAPAGTTFPLVGVLTDQGYVTAVSTTFNGKPLVLSYQGALTGTYGQDLQLTFSGMGLINGTVFSSGGVQTFLWDPAMGDYVTLKSVESGRWGLVDWRLAAAEALTAAELTAAGYQPTAVGFTTALKNNGTSMALSSLSFSPTGGPPLDPGGAPPWPAAPFPWPPAIGPNMEAMLFTPDFARKDMPEAIITGSYDEHYFNGTVTLVPEPSTWAMLALGFVLFGFRYRNSESEHFDRPAV